MRTTPAQRTFRLALFVVSPGDLARVNPNYRQVVCPFTGDTLTAVPAMRADVAIVHAQRADRAGNVLLEGIIGVQKEAVLAAARSVVTVEEVVDSFDGAPPNACILPHWAIGAIVVVPGGAFPSYTLRLLSAKQCLLSGVGRDFARSGDVYGDGWTNTSCRPAPRRLRVAASRVA